MYEILVKEDLTPTTKLFEILAPPVARKAQAGQFIIVRVDERGERTPLTVADYDRERGAITIVVQAVGKTTMHMCTLQRGDHFAALTGPLGHPSEIKNYGTVVCVGGGSGIAAVYPLARQRMYLDEEKQAVERWEQTCKQRPSDDARMEKAI